MLGGCTGIVGGCKRGESEYDDDTVREVDYFSASSESSSRFCWERTHIGRGDFGTCDEMG